MLFRSLTLAPVLTLAGLVIGCGGSPDPAAAPAVEVAPPLAATDSEPSAAPAASPAPSASAAAEVKGAPAPATAATSIATAPPAMPASAPPAAATGSSNAARAEALFNEGRAALAQGDNATACKKFDASLKLEFAV